MVFGLDYDRMEHSYHQEGGNAYYKTCKIHIQRFSGCKYSANPPIGRHSWIKVFTGFLVAAFQLWLMTERRDMASVISAASTMAHHGKSILL